MGRREHEESSSVCVAKEPCPKCGSRDNLGRYSDGHGWCFGCGHYEPGNGDTPRTTHRSPQMASEFTPIEGEVRPLGARKISEKTCEHFSYTVGVIDEAQHARMSPAVAKEFPVGTPVQLAPYFDAQGRLVAQKMRGPDKQFGVAGKLKQALPLFGQHLWRDGGKKVVITEGEIDCMSVSQLQDNKWPVVSVPNGSSGAKKSLAEALEWLERFETVVLMFDQDEPGRQAVAECAPLFSPGRCKVARLPLKDANEMLKAGRGAEVIQAIWDAKEYRPDGVLAASEVVERALKEPEVGYPWFLEELTAMTYGRRPGELYGFGAGTGVGKTDLFTQSIAFDLRQGATVGMLYLEQDVSESLTRIAGKWIGKVLHVPGEYDPAEREAAIRAVGETNRLYQYDAWGGTEWEVVKARMKYMIVALGCTHIYFDHLTALVAGEEDENAALKGIMEEMASLAKTTGAMIHYISHLATPEGKPHEEGGRVMVRHFRGSRAIGFWTHFMFGLERNQQADDPEERSRSRLRCLKDRNTGRATGKVLGLSYDHATGMLTPAPVQDESSPFPDRTSNGPASGAAKPEF